MIDQLIRNTEIKNAIHFAENWIGKKINNMDLALNDIDDWYGFYMPWVIVNGIKKGVIQNGEDDRFCIQTLSIWIMDYIKTLDE